MQNVKRIFTLSNVGRLFLLTIIIFIAHGFKQYLTPVHYLYIPVASVAILTILLYNDLQLPKIKDTNTLLKREMI